MVRSQLEVILNEFGAMQPRPGTFTLAAGRSITLHLAWGGTTFTIPSVRSVRIEDDVLFAETAEQTMAAIVQSIVAVTRS